MDVERRLPRSATLAAARPLRPASVAVNLSAAQLRDQSLKQMIQRTLERHRLSPRALELELTETAAARRIRRGPSPCSRELRALGVSLAIDDFGSGYSSLSYLKNLPFDKLKIDREFVVDVHLRKDSQAICRSLVELARGLGLRSSPKAWNAGTRWRRSNRSAAARSRAFFFQNPLIRINSSRLQLIQNGEAPFACPPAGRRSCPERCRHESETECAGTSLPGAFARHLRARRCAWPAAAPCKGRSARAPAQSRSKRRIGAGQQLVQQAIADLNRGDPVAARRRLMTALRRQPNDAVARQFITQIDTDPMQLLGRENYSYTLRDGETLSIDRGALARQSADVLCAGPVQQYRGSDLGHAGTNNPDPRPATRPAAPPPAAAAAAARDARPPQRRRGQAPPAPAQPAGAASRPTPLWRRD